MKMAKQHLVRKTKREKAQLQEVKPKFKPVKVVLKHEGETVNGPIGPLFFEGPKGFRQTSPVFLDLSQPSEMHKAGYFPAWFNYRQATRIAKKLRLPIEIF
jgi:hypothetical protein